MLIPSVFYGLYRDVKPRCRKIVTKLKRGATWEEVFSEDTSYLDVKSYSGSIVIEGTNVMYGFAPHFHCYVLHREIHLAIIYKKMAVERYEDIFTASLKTPWGLLGLFDANPSGWFRGFPVRGLIEDRVMRFLAACLLFWDELDSAGKRYCGPSEGTVWSNINNFNLFLAGAIQIQGLPSDFLELNFRRTDARISKEELSELVKTAQLGVHQFCLKTAETSRNSSS